LSEQITGAKVINHILGLKKATKVGFGSLHSPLPATVADKKVSVSVHFRSV